MKVFLEFAILFFVCFANATVPHLGDADSIAIEMELRATMQISKSTIDYLAAHGHNLNPDNRDCTWEGGDGAKLVEFFNGCWNKICDQAIENALSGEALSLYRKAVMQGEGRKALETLSTYYEKYKPSFEKILESIADPGRLDHSFLAFIFYWNFSADFVRLLQSAHAESSVSALAQRLQGPSQNPGDADPAPSRSIDQLRDAIAFMMTQNRETLPMLQEHEQLPSGESQSISEPDPRLSQSLKLKLVLLVLQLAKISNDVLETCDLSFYHFLGLGLVPLAEDDMDYYLRLCEVSRSIFRRSINVISDSMQPALISFICALPK